MTTIHLKGRITDTGELDVEVPDGLPPGEARVTIEVPIPREWSAQELDDVLKVNPMTGAEIVQADLLGGWADQGISDSQAWVEDLRRKRREQRSW